ncbi:hypothetical protein QN277_007265 [Acacia crassicarpa]|uniref:Retrotransposon gag domain-containing protein n=1 Tax=Acacia crassicarpa TaxID=499986 RepID=A0AAE1MCU2_9FABA|nr:hypothetical protein QN277_007265 [Acacia crassicarpa]
MGNVLDVNETKEIEIHQNIPPEDKKPLKDFRVDPSIDLLVSSITRPPVYASSFEINPTIIMMIKTSYQFRGLPSEDPYDHIADLLELCTTFKIQGVSKDAIYLRLFPLSLNGGAKRWLRNLPAGSIRTWKDMANQFLLKYYSLEKTKKATSEIFNFSQGVDEPLHEAWGRFKDLLKRCPHHGLPDLVISESFYFGLSSVTQLRVDAAAGSSALDKTPNEFYGLIERMARNLVMAISYH